jgi:regulator of nucleoside diphosphate kinase
MNTTTLPIANSDRRRLRTILHEPGLTWIEQRAWLQALDAELERAAEAESAEAWCDLVTMNATVDLRDVQSGEVETYRLVYPEQADIRQNWISVAAPIGTAILGRRVGDVVRVETPTGVRQIRVEAVHTASEYQDEQDVPWRSERELVCR